MFVRFIHHIIHHETGGRGSSRRPAGVPESACYRRDISHSCRSPASAARCNESMVPVFLSVPNTGLHQPHEQTAWAPPSADSCTVTSWSMRPASEVNDGATRRLAHAVDGLDPGAHEPSQV